MNRPVSPPTFPLLPVRWWEDPLSMGALVIALIIMVVAAHVAWRTYQGRKNKPLNNYDRWLYEISLIQVEPPSAVPDAYSELMRIIREYASHNLPALSQTGTDEEFIEQLNLHKEHLPSGFLELAEPIKTEAYSAKFAHEEPSSERVQKHITQIVYFLRKYQQ